MFPKTEDQLCELGSVHEMQRQFNQMYVVAVRHAAEEGFDPDDFLNLFDEMNELFYCITIDRKEAIKRARTQPIS